MAERRDENPWRNRLDLLATVVMLAAAITLIWSTMRRPDQNRAPSSAQQVAPLPTEPLSLEGATFQGSPTSTLVLLVFSDFECPYCARFSIETLPDIRRQYVDTNKVQIAFWNYPLPIHANAKGAAVAAECANTQGRFWNLHDVLFADTQKLSKEDVVMSAKALGLDMAAFETCLGDGVGTKQVNLDLKIGAGLGVKGTPAMFVGKRQADGRVLVSDRIAGARPFADFQAVFDKLAR